MSDYSFNKSKRLLTANDYNRVFKGTEAKASHRHLLLLARINNRSNHRLGLVIAKKNVRLAVQRNRVKRISREFFRTLGQSEVNLDVVLLSRRGLGELDSTQLSSILRQQWQKLVSSAFKSQTMATQDI
ncbi:MAG: ribonuclease P protein component [Halieaceae bacterium]|nr:ribonuclease P protein component [Halieaceae bacterium]